MDDESAKEVAQMRRVRTPAELLVYGIALVAMIGLTAIFWILLGGLTARRGRSPPLLMRSMQGDRGVIEPD